MLGADDDIVSTAGLILGVAAAGASSNSILVAGAAGLMAGSMSMAAGKYVSVSSQSDTENADLDREHIVVPLPIWSYRHLRFSNFSYSLIFIFICLHEIGTYYTYAEVPYGVWFNRITGMDINAALGFERNHFDRLVHFLYGFLLLPACVEIFEARARLIGFWRHLVPITFIMSHSELFEMIEWQAAEIFGGPLGQAYLGTQGDIWDAQKDSLAAMVGAISSTIFCQLYLSLKIKFKRDRDRDRVEKSHA